jgi:hypothetical protein
VRDGRGLILAALAVAVLAPTLAACGDDEPASTSGSFDRADLENLVPPPSAAPDGTAVNRQMLGYGALRNTKSGRRWLRELKGEGLEDSYLIQFVPDGGKGDDLFVESMAFLFEDPESAQSGLGVIREQNVAILPPADELSSADLGEEAWGLAGDYGPEKQPTATFGVRTGNVVQTSTYAGLSTSENAGEAERLAAEQQGAAEDLAQ